MYVTNITKLEHQRRQVYRNSNYEFLSLRNYSRLIKETIPAYYFTLLFQLNISTYLRHSIAEYPPEQWSIIIKHTLDGTWADETQNAKIHINTEKDTITIFATK